MLVLEMMVKLGVDGAADALGAYHQFEFFGLKGSVSELWFG